MLGTSFIVIMLTLTTLGVSSVEAAECYFPYYPNFVVFPNTLISRASNGHTLALYPDEPFFELWSRAEDIQGVYDRFDAQGSLVDTGVWQVSKQLIFKSYGCVDGNGYVYGGRVVFRVRLFSGYQGTIVGGTLEFESTRGDPPPDAAEGFRLFAKSWGIDFDDPVSGSVWFYLF
jgi:hypothetical protein